MLAKLTGPGGGGGLAALRSGAPVRIPVSSCALVGVGAGLATGVSVGGGDAEAVMAGIPAGRSAVPASKSS